MTQYSINNKILVFLQKTSKYCMTTKKRYSKRRLRDRVTGKMLNLRPQKLLKLINFTLQKQKVVYMLMMATQWSEIKWLKLILI